MLSHQRLSRNDLQLDKLGLLLFIGKTEQIAQGIMGVLHKQC